MRVKRERGFVLLTVLMFISLIVLWVMMGLNVSVLQIEMNRNRNTVIEEEFIAEAGLKIAYSALTQDSRRCLLEKPISTYDLSKKSSAWWNSSIACGGRFAGRSFRYVIEYLGEGTLEKSDRVDFYRITVAVQTVDQGRGIVWQGTSVLPISTSGRSMKVWQSFRQLR